MKYENTIQQYGIEKRELKRFLRKMRTGTEGDVVEEEFREKEEEGGRDWLAFLSWEKNRKQPNLDEIVVLNIVEGTEEIK